MEKQLKDVIHLYIGGHNVIYDPDRMILDSHQPLFPFYWSNFEYVINGLVSGKFKLCLRQLSSMTEEEMKEMVLLGWVSIREMNLSFQFRPDEVKRNTKYAGGIPYSMFKPDGSHFGVATLSLRDFTTEQFQCLLSKGFDIFDLIPAGLAIDHSTINQ